VIETLAKLLPIAVAGAFLPTWTRDTILLLGTGTPPWNSVSFVAGNASCRMALGLSALFVVDSDRLVALAQRESRTNPWLLAGGAVVCLVLAVVAFERPEREPGPDPDRLPSWIAALERVPWYAAFALGFAFMLLPGVQYVYFFAGITVIASSGLAPLEEIVLLVVFVLLLETMVATPLAIYAIRPHASKALLERFKGWIGRNGPALGAAIFAILGIALGVSAIVQFAG